MVPREPTAGMWDSAETAMIESELAYDVGKQDARSDAPGFPTMRIWQAVVAYRALLAAAPQPPSAPVGVDEVVRKVCERLDKVADYANTIDGETVVVALSNLPAVLARALSEALAQQPAAGAAMEFDGTDREVLREFIRICREHKPVGPWPGERVCKAIERAMDNEKPFRFIAEADMAPERAPSMKDTDRMLSGPRRAAGHLDRKRFERAPCYLCGYNGEGYYQPDKHPCAARYHAQQHAAVDGAVLP